MALAALTGSFLHARPLSCPSRQKVMGPTGGTGRTRQRSSVVVCRKKDIHPEFYEDSKVYCNGELVFTTGGTSKEYVVDVWSGNHPFYLGDRTGLELETSQIEKFRRKYPGMAEYMEVPTLQGEIIIPKGKSYSRKRK